MPEKANQSTPGAVRRLLCHLLPGGLFRCGADPRHPHGRRLTAGYRRKLSTVKNIWIGWGVLSLISGAPPMMVVLGLIATFTSFMVLDECA